MDKYRKQLAWSSEDGGWIATSPDFPGLSAFGESDLEATEQLHQVIAGAVETYQEAGWEIPQPRELQTEFSGQLRLRLPRSLHALAAERAEQEGVSLNALLQGYIAEGLGMRSAERSIVESLSTLLGATSGHFYQSLADSVLSRATNEWNRGILYGNLSKFDYKVPVFVSAKLEHPKQGGTAEKKPSPAEPEAFHGRTEVRTHLRPELQVALVPEEVYK